MQNLADYLHNQLNQYGADAPELWNDADAVHSVIRIVHEAGKMRLLALLSLLSAHMHKASTAILFSSTDAQNSFKQHVEEVCLQAHQALSSATMSATPAALLHQEYLTLECSTSVAVITHALQPPAASPPPLSSAVGHPLCQPEGNCQPERLLLCIADHDLCTSDSMLRQFWGHLHQQQQQHSKQQQQPQQSAASSHTQTQASALLGRPSGHLGRLWRIASMTYSLPGLASTLTGSQEPGFSTHFIHTGLLKHCTAHPMMMPEEQDMKEVQRRVTPQAAAAAVRHAQDEQNDHCAATWYASHPGLLQWLAILTETAAVTGSALSSDSKMIVVIGAAESLAVDPIVDHAEASGLNLAALELDSADGLSMLTTTPDSFLAVAGAVDPAVVMAGTKEHCTAGFQQGRAAPKLVLSQKASAQDRIAAVCAAAASVSTAEAKPIHSILLLSWESALKLQSIMPEQILTDLYLCDLAGALGPNSTAPLTEMAAAALHAVSRHLCGVFPR